MSGEIKIVWLPAARDKLKKIISYIKKDSFQNSQKVKREILQKITALSENPERYPPDKFKLLNTGNYYRAFELHRIRISYFINTDQVMIIRIRHVKQESLFY